MRKMLMVATVPSMIGQFNMHNIKMLQDMDCEVHVACDFTDRSVWTEERVKLFEDELREKGIKSHQIDFSRSVSKIHRHFRSYKELKTMTKANQYDFVHCHTPIAGAISRIVCKATKTKCIYTAHGFHFFDGAPLKNWMFFYPIEWLCSWMTDVLITINREDYERANKYLYAKKTQYVPGVGVDASKYKNTFVEKQTYRNKFDLPKNAIVVLSVGELNANKNHAVVIRALSELKDKNIHYLIAGKGELKQELEELATSLGVDKNVHLIGYRNDVAELYKLADIYVLPSIREGLNVSLMEAMASGLPCVVSDIRGNRDLIPESERFSPMDCMSVADKIKVLIYDVEKKKICGAQNEIKMQEFDIQIVQRKMQCIYESMMNQK